MKIVCGKGASGGIASGKLMMIKKPEQSADEGAVLSRAEIPSEIKRLEAAIGTARDELDVLYNDAVEKVGKSDAAIFEIHRMLADDEDLRAAAREFIENDGKPARIAIILAGKKLSRIFEAMDDEYMSARAEDIIAVADRISSILSGGSRKIELGCPTIIVSSELTPADTVSIDRTLLRGFVTDGGSIMSHTSILARNMGIPAVIGVGEGSIPTEYDGQMAVIDGDEGVVYIDPDSATDEKFARLSSASDVQKQRLERYRGKTCIGKYGERITVEANAGSLSDIDDAMRSDAEGIGLFRSEFIYMGRSFPPTEDEQFEIYKSAVRKCGERECVIRTLDAGADKKIAYLAGDGGSGEANPALGLRAVRLCLRKPELLYTQFRALYRAAVFGNLSAMIPMLVLPAELDSVRKIAREAQDSLLSDGISFGKMKVGIMIETPSAAVLSDEFAKKADFFSIGTNDLIQYTVAADRENPEVAYLTEKMPESVRRLIKLACKSARGAGIPVGVCGELGADTSETRFFVECGVTKLSVAPPSVLLVRESVANTGARVVKNTASVMKP